VTGLEMDVNAALARAGIQARVKSKK